MILSTPTVDAQGKGHLQLLSVYLRLVFDNIVLHVFETVLLMVWGLTSCVVREGDSLARRES